MPVYTTNRATTTVSAGKELAEDKGGKITIKTATQTLDTSTIDKNVLVGAGVGS